MTSGVTVTLWLSFAAGFVSLISPCVLALLPVYVTYLSGVSATNASPDTSQRWHLLGNALLFISGFTVVFVAFGLGGIALGRVLLRNQDILRQAAGVIVIIFGLHTADLLRIPFLMREAKAFSQMPKASPLRSFLLGMAFSAGWSPCVGPILSGVIALAMTRETVGEGLVQLLSYSVGMGIPFLLIALFITRLRGAMRWVQQHSVAVSRVTGLLLIVIGIMLFTDSFSRLASMFNYWDIL